MHAHTMVPFGSLILAGCGPAVPANTPTTDTPNPPVIATSVPAAAPPPVGGSRPIGFRPGTSFACPFPREADTVKIDRAIVSIQITVGVDGTVLSATVKNDPGYGFGEAARLCVMGTRYQPALDQAGTPVVASTAINVRFQR
jgi:protein TonB